MFRILEKRFVSGDFREDNFLLYYSPVYNFGTAQSYPVDSYLFFNTAFLV